MLKQKLTNVALAIGAASAFALAPVVASAADQVTEVHCKGLNSCKGQGSCKTVVNSCKGQNSCKGEGWVAKSSVEECKKAGGTVVVADTVKEAVTSAQ